MSDRHVPRVRAFVLASVLAAMTVFTTVATVAAGSGGGPFPR